MSSPDRLTHEVRRLLEGNRVTAAGGRYTRPAHRTYPHQWLWDSCFHARVYHLLGDDAYAKDELRALFRAQERDGLDAGRLPHMTFLGGHEGELREDEDAAAAYRREVAVFRHPHASSITQPPIVAETVRLIEDLEFWRELWPQMSAYYDWWMRRRNPRGDHLYVSWHIWECGADATPRGDVACARLLATGRTPRALAEQTVNPTAKKRQDMLAARFLMLEDLQDIDAAEQDGRLSMAQADQRRLALWGHVPVDLQAYLVRNFTALAEIAERLEHREAAARYRNEAAAIVVAVREQLWDEEAGFYFDRFGEPAEVARVLTHAPFIALYADDLVPREHAERLLAHLLDPGAFWTRWPLPTTARCEPTFDADDYWRGSTWINVNWFTVQGLVRCSETFGDPRYLAAAKALADKTLELVRELGFREYYRSGAPQAAGDADIAPAGFGPDGFGWSGLVLDLVELAGG